MSRTVCLAIILGSLVAAPGCSSCFGGASSCRRPSFMEFRSPCSSRQSAPACAAPMAAPCAPACEPACGPSAAPCCEESGAGMSTPVVVSESGTFS